MALALHVGLLHSLRPPLHPQQDEQDPECNSFDPPQPVNSLLGLTIPETQGWRALWVAQLTSQLEKGNLLHSFQVSNRQESPSPTQTHNRLPPSRGPDHVGYPPSSLPWAVDKGMSSRKGMSCL